MNQKDNFQNEGYQPEKPTPQPSDNFLFEGYQPPKEVSKPALPPKKP